MDSILTSTKVKVGIVEEETSFDEEIIDIINTAFQTLWQLGAISKRGFAIEDSIATWDDILGDSTDNEGIKSYIKSKVKMDFDPPANSSHMEALKNRISELEFRLQVDNNVKEEEVEDDESWR